MAARRHLPTADSPHIQLVVATAQEALAQQNANSDEWRGALTLDAYIRREDHLIAQVLTKDGGLTPWMLVYQPPPSANGDGQERQVLCGCESIKKKALLAKRNGGGLEEVVAHGIASVFCAKDLRGRGYAGRMMSELGKKLKYWQVDDVKQETSAFSVLYSDIGKEFYKAHGWEPFPSAHISLPSNSSPKNALRGVGKLESEDLEELCAIDASILRARLSRDSSPQTMVALLPDYATLQWHHAREDFVATELHPANGKGTTPEFMDGGRGAIIEVKDGSRVWCYWTRVWTNPQEDAPNTLHILRIVIEKEYPDFRAASSSGIETAKKESSDVVEGIASLLAYAQVQAKRSGMHEVQIWNPTSTTLAAAQLVDEQAAVMEREKESIASLQWYGEGSWKDVEWVCNEKYGWC